MYEKELIMIFCACPSKAELKQNVMMGITIRREEVWICVVNAPRSCSILWGLLSFASLVQAILACSWQTGVCVWWCPCCSVLFCFISQSAVNILMKFVNQNCVAQTLNPPLPSLSLALFLLVLRDTDECFLGIVFYSGDLLSVYIFVSIWSCPYI